MIRKQDQAICEGRIEFRQGKYDFVSVCCSHNQVGCQAIAPQFFSQF
jgi:hypothetical protein